jgi:hypothetical protein
MVPCGRAFTSFDEIGDVVDVYETLEAVPMETVDLFDL